MLCLFYGTYVCNPFVVIFLTFSHEEFLFYVSISGFVQVIPTFKFEMTLKIILVPAPHYSEDIHLLHGE